MSNTHVDLGGVDQVARGIGVNGGIYQASGGARRTGRDKLADHVSVTDYYFTTDPDDTLSFTRAQATGKAVFVPAGRGHGTNGNYLVHEITLISNALFYGEGAASVLQLATIVDANVFYALSASAATYIENVTIRDMKLLGRVTESGFLEQAHLMRLSGVRNLLIEDVQFVGFAGDGVYLGSGDAPGVERHNVNVVIARCLFDGVNKNQRNGISGIDINSIVVDSCYFKNCSRNGAPGYVSGPYDTFDPSAGKGMPGPIDFEPDSNAVHVVTDVTITNNTFDNCGGNLGQVSLLIPAAVPLPQRVRITGNKFTNYTGTGADAVVSVNRAITSADIFMSVLIEGNQGANGNRPYDLYACRGVQVINNTWNTYASYALIGSASATASPWDIKINNIMRLCGAAGEGVRIFNPVGIVFGGTLDQCGSDAANGYPIQFANATSNNVTLQDLKIIKRASQTTAINNSGHTFNTPTTNRMLNVDLDGMTNQFQFRAELRATATYSNGWVDGGTIIERDVQGRVSVNLNITSGTLTAGTLVMSLPVGYRPTAQVFGIFVSGTSFGTLRFDGDGSVFITPNAAPAASMRGFISFATGQ